MYIYSGYFIASYANTKIQGLTNTMSFILHLISLVHHLSVAISIKAIGFPFPLHKVVPNKNIHAQLRTRVRYVVMNIARLYKVRCYNKLLSKYYID